MLYKRIKEEREALLKDYLKDVIAKCDTFYILFFFKKGIKEEKELLDAAYEESLDACCKYCKEHDISIIFEAVSDATPQEQAELEAMSETLAKYKIMVDLEAQFFYFLFRARGKVWKARIIYWMAHKHPDLLMKGPWRHGLFGR